MNTPVFRVAFVALSCACAGSAAQLVVNGGFETGLSGWTVMTEAGSAAGSNFFAINGTTTPQSGASTVGPRTGSFYAVSDGSGPEAHALLQSFTVPGPASSVVLSFSLFVNSYGGNIVNPVGLDYTDGANQHARVDILRAGASAFDTGSGVLRNFYIGADTGSNPHAYTDNTFDITSLVGAGGTFQLRFGEVDNVNFLNMGVDNVSINSTLASAPEPSSIALSVLGLIGLFVSRARRTR